VPGTASCFQRPPFQRSMTSACTVVPDTQASLLPLAATPCRDRYPAEDPTTLVMRQPGADEAWAAVRPTPKATAATATGAVARSSVLRVVSFLPR
jgi:hypothetical protein